VSFCFGGGWVWHFVGFCEVEGWNGCKVVNGMVVEKGFAKLVR